MEKFMIYLDGSNPKRLRFLWISQAFLGAIWITQGILGFYHPGRLPWFAWVQVCGGMVVLVLILLGVVCLKRYGRLRLILSEEGIESKVKLLEEAKRMSWEEVNQVHLKLNEAEIIPKANGVERIKIPLGSYELNQRVKQSLKEYAEGRGIEVIS